MLRSAHNVSFTTTPPVGALGGCVTIGNFDGVHRGHQMLLAELRKYAHQLGLPAVVMTFHPHPMPALTGAPCEYIQSVDDRIEGLLAHGADAVWVYPFSHALAALTADQFAHDVLHAQLQAKAVVVGPDFRYGAKRSGDVATLRQAGLTLGFLVDSLASPLEDDGAPASSTRIRAAIKLGDMESVERVMGHAYRITGTVQTGRRLGTQLGFPTANLAPPPDELLPPYGVYVVTGRTPDSPPMPGVTSLGVRPTFDNGPVLIETHFLDISPNLYGKTLTIEFHKKIRGELRFDSPQSLIQAMHSDLATARTFFSWCRSENACCKSSIIRRVNAFFLSGRSRMIVPPGKCFFTRTAMFFSPQPRRPTLSHNTVQLPSRPYCSEACVC